MRNLLKAGAAAVGLLTVGLVSTPASAAVLLASPITCNIYDTVNGGCNFTLGTGAEANDIAAILAEYNLKINPDLPTDVDYLGRAESGAVADAGGATIPGLTYVNGGTTWTFASLPFAVSFYTVKAANEVTLFGLAPASTSVTAENNLIVNNSGRLQNISHVNFYSLDTGPGPDDLGVPEPATWAMMIMGFGGVGAMMRRRRTLAA